MIRRCLASALALVGVAISATPAAALLLWTLTATPLTATSGVATTFSLTATNLDLLTELGCLEVDLPASFDIVGASAGSAPNGHGWEAVVFANKVAVHSLSGDGRLELGQAISFTITAVPMEAGAWTWTNHAHRPQDCSSAEEVGTPIEVLVVQGATRTPEPTPAPTPTPTPILPIGPLPTLPPVTLPTLPALPTLRPSTPTPTAVPTSDTSSPTPRATPVATASSNDGPGAQGGTTPPPPASNLDSGSAAPVVRGIGEREGGPDGPVGEVSLGPLGVIDGITVWAIPGAIVGGPGLLVILWVIFQTGVALAWIPAVRRMRGPDESLPNWRNGQTA